SKVSTPEPFEKEQNSTDSNESLDIPKLNASQPIDFKQKSQEYEVDVLSQALRLCQFNQKKTASFLGLTYHQLRGYLKKYQLLEGASAAND
ncbi:MAG: phage shock protein operon transcriptional activator, partial [Idiomarina sp.]|nr:phage shock protein operon transcriptional activator [Idiomarina sp.]